MFNHPGEKLKSLAKVIFAFIVIIGVIVAIVVGAAVKNLGFFIAIIALGILIGWLASVALYAFGALVADVESIKVTLYAIADRGYEIDPPEDQTENYPRDPVFVLDRNSPAPIIDRDPPDPESIDIEAIKRAAQERKENKE